MTWTDGVDQATGTLITGSIWNQYNGVSGSLMMLKAHSHTGAAGDGAVTLMPNLVLNSDFGRRTVFGLAMPEVFADTLGWVALDAGTAGSVASNQWTMGTVARTRAKWGLPTWRDMRASAQFKATDVAAPGIYDMLHIRYTDVNNTVDGYCVNGTFNLQKNVAGVATQLATGVAQALTVNNWYWMETDAQGTTFVAKLYSSGAAPVAKASATLLQTLTGSASDAVLAAGYISVDSAHTTNAGIWGGVSTGNGGLYVETWLPESWVADYTSWGTLGGQAVGIDETTGPLGKQWSLRGYIPATSRKIRFYFNSPEGAIAPSTGYTFSAYNKTSGYAGSGDLGQMTFRRYSAAFAGLLATSTLSLNDVAWTRRPISPTTEASAVDFQVELWGNPSGTATGTFWIDLPQLEQGSAATAWRPNPGDGLVAPALWRLQRQIASLTTTSVSYVEIEPRDLAANIFLPEDATVVVEIIGVWSNSGVGNINSVRLDIDGLSVDGFGEMAPTPMPTTGLTQMYLRASTKVAAGKHRITSQWKVSAGTGTLSNGSGGGQYPLTLLITATRGK